MCEEQWLACNFATVSFQYYCQIVETKQFCKLGVNYVRTSINLNNGCANYRTNVSAGAFETLQQSIVCPANWPSRDKNSEIRQVRYISMLSMFGSRIHCWRLDRGSTVDSKLDYVHILTCSSVCMLESVSVRSVEMRTDHRRTPVVQLSLCSVISLFVRSAYNTYCAHSLVRLYYICRYRSGLGLSPHIQ